MLTNFTTNTSSSAVSSKHSSVNVIASGTWGGATLSVEVKDQSSGDWVSVYDATANIQKNVMIGSGMSYRLTVAGGVGHDIDVYTIEVPTKSVHI